MKNPAVQSLPTHFENEGALDDFITRPDEAVAEALAAKSGDLAILGVAGKMGLHVAALAARSLEKAGIKKKVYGVARFSDPAAKKSLEAWGVIPVAADLTDPAAVRALPDAGSVIFMAGKKFGTAGSEATTWAMNTVAPHLAAERYPNAATVVYSTGCVYPFVAPATGGCREGDTPMPVGDYAQSALGRERVYEWHALKGTPVCLFRLNYAVEPRYGVLRDLAEKIQAGEPVSLSQGWVNLIWQGDAVRQSLLCLNLAAAPATVINITGPEILPVRQLATDLGSRLGKTPIFSGTEGGVAFLSHAGKSFSHFGYPRVPAAAVLDWTADWMKRGLRSLGKPTHFEEASGKY